MKWTAASLLFMCQTLATPIELVEERSIEERQSCPNIHVFGARETTVSQGYGTAGVFVNLILNAYPGATSEAIVYPACGGQSSCGGVSYANSVQQGVAAVASAVNSFNTKCPNTLLVLVGYSQVSTRRNNPVANDYQTDYIRVDKFSMTHSAEVVIPTRASPTPLFKYKPQQ
jgi:acetylxylan esterase